ncbi:hypothetical protein IW262DRAFT_1374500 [Armillaria fumosa]|nr:hypothetical protein IW262DRAFT_1374500 [Armillaria fumosa]
MWSESIPTYYESKSLEEAWAALVNTMDADYWGELFFLCPEPGNVGKKSWPSWDQVMAKPLPAYHVYSRIHVDRGENQDEDSCDEVWCAEGLVRGLAVVGEDDRRGELVIKGEGGTEHGFEITASHTYAIPEDTYTMICICEVRIESSLGCSWVVGRSLLGGKFEKVSVLEMSP